jgi:catechol 2,3-dioxygenase-like lactoylglutathione lyase family enzyme
MSLLTIADSFYIGVGDIAAARTWYIDKLGLQVVSVDLDEPEGCITLGFSKNDQISIVLGPRQVERDQSTPMLYTSNPKKTREILIGKGVCVGELNRDRQGTDYFEIRDLEGNAIEISSEP